MNSEQWSAIIRTILALLMGPGSYLVVKGVLTPDQANQLIPVLVPAVTGVGGILIAWWGHHANTASALTAAVNSDSVPGVKVVRLDAPAQQVAVTPTGTVVPDTGPKTSTTGTPKS